MNSFILRSLFGWMGLFVLAFANGTLREIVIKPLAGEPWAHWLSAATAVLIFTTYLGLIWKKLAIASLKQAACVGLLWFALTNLVEIFFLNRFISHLTWEQIWQTFNIANGELWPLVVAWIGLLPLVLFAIHKNSVHGQK